MQALGPELGHQHGTAQAQLESIDLGGRQPEPT